MATRPRLSGFLRDLVATTATSIASLVGVVLVTALLARGLGEEGFGAYSLARRTWSLLDAAATLAMGVAIPRYVAMATDAAGRAFWLRAGVLLGVLPGLAIAGAAAALRDFTSVALFKSTVYTPLLLAVSCLLVSHCIYTVLYAFYRGSGQIAKANWWQLFATVGGPIIVAAWFGSRSEVHVIVLLMSLCFAVSGVPLVRHLLAPVDAASRGTFRRMTAELARYGAPRVPGGFALSGFFALGPSLASYYGALEDAGYFVAAQSLFRLIEAGVAAFGVVALPRVAQLFAEGRQAFLRDRIGEVAAFALHVGVFATLHLALWSDVVVLAWLGPSFAKAIPVMQTLSLGVVPYMMYILLRSIVDAVENTAVNTVNLFIGLGIAVFVSGALAWLGLTLVGPALGTVVGLGVLGLLTVRSLSRRYPLSRGTFVFRQVVWANVALAIVAFGIKQVLSSELTGAVLVIAGGTAEVALFVGYTVLLRRLRVDWLEQLVDRIRS